MNRGYLQGKGDEYILSDIPAAFKDESSKVEDVKKLHYKKDEISQGFYHFYVASFSSRMCIT